MQQTSAAHVANTGRKKGQTLTKASDPLISRFITKKTARAKKRMKSSNPDRQPTIATPSKPATSRTSWNLRNSAYEKKRLCTMSPFLGPRHENVSDSLAQLLKAPAKLKGMFYQYS
jgi:hypothetical protein